MNSTLRPKSIHGAQITVQQVSEETLLYDARTHKAWCLNRSSASIWRLCNGSSTVQEIAQGATRELGAPVSEDLVLLTLAELREKELLVEPAGELLPDGLSRRALLGKAGLAAAALLPVIAAITAPSALALGGSVGTGGSQSILPNQTDPEDQ